MLWRGMVLGAAAALVLAAWARPARADDTIRLDLRGGVPTVTLDGDSSADTVLAHGWRRGFYRGAYYGGFYPRYYGGFYPRYYGYYPRYYYPRVSFGLGFYRPYYYAPPVYSTYYAPPVYYAPSSLYFSWNSGCLPISLSASVTPYAVLQPGRSVITEQYRVPNTNPMPPADDGTYQYDGGPQNPVPMPKAEPGPANGKGTQLPPGRVVSLPTRSAPKYTYPAYGEKPARPAFAEDRVAAARSGSRK